MELPFPPLQYKSSDTSSAITHSSPETSNANTILQTCYVQLHSEKPGYYQCMLCKMYDSKLRYNTEAHVKECLRKKETKKKKQEEKEKVDTQVLYTLVIQLQKEVAVLRQQIKDMKKQELQKINIPYWLNHHCQEPLPTQTFHEWRKSSIFQPTDEQLQLVFNHHLKKGIQDCIRHVIETEDHSTFPIRAFAKQRHVFYIYEYPPRPPASQQQEQETSQMEYEPEPEWRKMSKEEFHHWLETIGHKYLLKFNEWEQINQEWLDSDTNHNEYTKYLNIINTLIEDMEPQTIRNWLYDELKRPLKRIVELEFEDS